MEHFANLNQLVEAVRNYEWFRSTGLDEYGRFVIYVSRMDYNILKDIPAKIDNQQVLFHFFYPQYQYITSVSNTITQVEKNMPNKSIFQEEINIEKLTSDLDNLESICGSEILGHIFFETHDQHNAVTYFSTKYPEVREKMEKLYRDYGFDILYEQLEL